MLGESTPVASPDEAHELELAADEAILACGGDLRETIKALLTLNDYLEQSLAQVSYGYARGHVGMQVAG